MLPLVLLWDSWHGVPTPLDDKCSAISGTDCGDVFHDQYLMACRSPSRHPLSSMPNPPPAAGLAVHAWISHAAAWA